MTKKRNPAKPAAPKPWTYDDERRSGLETPASGYWRNAAAHDRRRIPQSWLDMDDAAGLEAHPAPVADRQSGSDSGEAQNPQIAPD
jgi:hypothetical protein